MSELTKKDGLVSLMEVDRLLGKRQLSAVSSNERTAFIDACISYGLPVMNCQICVPDWNGRRPGFKAFCCDTGIVPTEFFHKRGFLPFLVCDDVIIGKIGSTFRVFSITFARGGIYYLEATDVFSTNLNSLKKIYLG